MEEKSIAENIPRVKFQATWKGSLPDVLQDKALAAQFEQCFNPLADGLLELEKEGVTPVCPDGKVGGNASFRMENSSGQKYVLVTKSGKYANQRLHAENDLSMITSFDAEKWSAEYYGESSNTLPTSDTPLHWESYKAAEKFQWKETPSVILHGHALETEEKARELGFPISSEETLFSTPEDTQALMRLYEKYPYPENQVFIRLGHGFMLLARDMEDGMQVFRKQIQPFLK